MVRLSPRQKQRAHELRRDATDAERRLWQYLRLKQVGERRFRRQFSLGPFIADFVCLPARLVIEVDGGQHADNRGDEYRTHWLEREGFEVLRVWNNDVLANTEGVVETIVRVANERLVRFGG